MKRLLVFLRQEIYFIFFTWYIFVWIPLTLIFIFLGTRIDILLGLHKFIPRPYNILFFAFFISMGVIIVLWSYSYLVFEGRMKKPTLYFGQTEKLVKVGPYSIVRHPAVIGKLFSVIGLGFLFQSFTFTFIIIPILFVGSIIDKMFREERQLTKKWGKEYIEYKKSTPMIIPKIKRRD